MLTFAKIGAGWTGGIHAERLRRCEGTRLGHLINVDAKPHSPVAGDGVAEIGSVGASRLRELRFGWPTGAGPGYAATMPFTHNAARRHRIPKALYRVRNWPAY